MARVEINHKNILKTYIALQNKPADEKRDRITTPDIKHNNLLKI